MKKILLFTLTTAVFLAAALYLSLPSILARANVRQIIEQQLHNLLGRPVAFESLSLEVFPRVHCSIRELSLLELDEPFLIQGREARFQGGLSLAKLDLNIAIFPLLFGKMNLRDIQWHALAVEGALVQTELPAIPVRIQGVAGQIARLDLQQPIPFEISSSQEAKEGYIAAAGQLQLDSKATKIDRLATKIQVSALELPLLNSFSSLLGLPPATQILAGKLTGEIQFDLKENQSQLMVDLKANEFSYQCRIHDSTVSSVVFDWGIKGAAHLDLTTLQAKLEPTKITLGSSSIRLQGLGNLKTFESLLLHLQSDETNWASLLSLIPEMRQWMPLQVGFSGNGSFDIELSREGAQSAVHGVVDLKETVLEIPQWFSKAAGTTFKAELQFNSRDVSKYHGDLRLSLGDLNITGSDLSYDVATGDFSGGIVSNRLALESLSAFTPQGKNYGLRGWLTAEGNLSGKFEDLTKATYQGKIICEDISVEPVAGLRVSGLSARVFLDAPLLRVESLALSINDAPVKGEFLLQLAPAVKWNGKIEGGDIDLRALDAILIPLLGLPSPEIDPKGSETISNVPAKMPEEGNLAATSLSSPRVLPPEVSVAIPQADSSFRLQLKGLALLGERLGNLRFVLSGKPKYLQLHDFRFGIGGGTVAISGEAYGRDFLKQDLGEYRIEIALQDIIIDELGDLFSETKKFVGGQLTGKAAFSGFGVQGEAAKDKLTGSGELTFLRGQLKTLDFLQIISAVRMFLQLQAEKRGFTRFDEMGLTFRLANGRLESNDFRLSSENFDLSGLGSLTLNGDINWRMNVLLSEKLSKKVSPIKLETERVSVPVQIYNTLENPKFSVERAVTQALINNAIQRGFESLLGKAQKEPVSSSGSPDTSSGDTGPIS